MQNLNRRCCCCRLSFCSANANLLELKLTLNTFTHKIICRLTICHNPTTFYCRIWQAATRWGEPKRERVRREVKLIWKSGYGDGRLIDKRRISFGGVSQILFSLHRSLLLFYRHLALYKQTDHSSPVASISTHTRYRYLKWAPLRTLF